MHCDDLYTGIANELLGQLRRLSIFTKHGPSIGRYHEDIVRPMLEASLPRRYSIRSGFAYDGENVSLQGDILIIDENDPAPYFFKSNDFVVVHPRAVVCVIEVKTKLNKKDFLESLENLASFRRISTPPWIPMTLLFAFDSPTLTPDRLDEWYKAVKLPDEISWYPYLILSLKKGLLILVAEKEGRSYGHYFVMEGESGKSQTKNKSLSIFLQTFRKQLEYRGGLKSNPFIYASLEDLKLSRQYFRYNVGCKE